MEKVIPKLWKHQEQAVQKAMTLNNMFIFFDIGCVAGDTEIRISRCTLGKRVPISRLYSWQIGDVTRDFDNSVETKIRSYNGTNMYLNTLDKAHYNGVKDTYDIITEHTRILTCTLDHHLLTKNGYKQARELTSEDYVAIDLTTKHTNKGDYKKIKNKIIYKKRGVGRYYVGANTQYNKDGSYKSGSKETHILTAEAQLNNMTLDQFIDATYSTNSVIFLDKKEYAVHHIDGNPLNNDISNLKVMTHLEHSQLHGKRNHTNFGHGALTWVKFRELKFNSSQPVYDLTCRSPDHNYVANDYIVHNCGKTAVAINICRQIYARHGKVLPTLILAPASILRQWQAEFGIFSKIDSHKVHAILDTGKKRVENIQKVLSADSDCILILNYEALLNDDLFKILKVWGIQALIADESQLTKSPTSKRSKKVLELAKDVTYRYALTGTPILKNALDLFMQFKIIDGGKTFGNNLFVYRSKYFMDKNAGWSSKPGYFPQWAPNPAMYPELTAKVASIAVQAKKHECIDLPEYVQTTRYCTMSPEQKKSYTEMERDFLTYLKEDHGELPRAAIAQVAISKSLRLIQIASGYVTDANGNDFYFAKNPKIDLLEELLEELEGQKVIIWAHFKANHKMIISLLDKMKIKYVQLDGNATLKEKADRQELFETKPEYLVCLANQGAAGTGINLKAAGYSIYYSKDYSYGKDEQSAGRNYRGGSIDLHSKVTRFDLITEGTIEEKVMEIIKNKQEISNIILDWSKL